MYTRSLENRIKNWLLYFLNGRWNADAAVTDYLTEAVDVHVCPFCSFLCTSWAGAPSRHATFTTALLFSRTRQIRLWFLDLTACHPACTSLPAISIDGQRDKYSPGCGGRTGAGPQGAPPKFALEIKKASLTAVHSSDRGRSQKRRRQSSQRTDEIPRREFAFFEQAKIRRDIFRQRRRRRRRKFSWEIRESTLPSNVLLAPRRLVRSLFHCLFYNYAVTAATWPPLFHFCKFNYAYGLNIGAGPGGHVLTLVFQIEFYFSHSSEKWLRSLPKRFMTASRVQCTCTCCLFYTRVILQKHRILRRHFFFRQTLVFLF